MKTSIGLEIHPDDYGGTSTGCRNGRHGQPGPLDWEGEARRSLEPGCRGIVMAFTAESEPYLNRCDCPCHTTIDWRAHAAKMRDSIAAFDAEFLA